MYVYVYTYYSVYLTSSCPPREMRLPVPTYNPFHLKALHSVTYNPFHLKPVPSQNNPFQSVTTRSKALQPVPKHRIPPSKAPKWLASVTSVSQALHGHYQALHVHRKRYMQTITHHTGLFFIFWCVGGCLQFGMSTAGCSRGIYFLYFGAWVGVFSLG